MSTLKIIVRKGEDGRIELCAPSVGLWRDKPMLGAVLSPGEPIGVLEVLGRKTALTCPAGAGGAIVERASENDAALPVGRGTVLLVLDTSQRVASSSESDEAASGDAALVVKAPSAGRFYSRPSPGKPAFVNVGDVIEAGQPIGLLEVMKTFSRVLFEGDGLPPKAKVTSILFADGDDVSRGDALVAFEPAD